MAIFYVLFFGYNAPVPFLLYLKKMGDHDRVKMETTVLEPQLKNETTNK